MRQLQFIPDHAKYGLGCRTLLPQTTDIDRIVWSGPVHCMLQTSLEPLPIQKLPVNHDHDERKRHYLQLKKIELTRHCHGQGSLPPPKSPISKRCRLLLKGPPALPCTLDEACACARTCFFHDSINLFRCRGCE